MGTIREASAIEILSQSKKLFSAEELAALLGITSRNVLDLARRGDLPAIKIGRLVRFDGWKVARSLGVL